jgi:exodeoxyribonuclease V alpha subunit
VSAPAAPTPAQWAVVEQVAAHRLTALSGGPGTGKTFALRTLVEVAAAAGVEVALAAPTGKAARRIAELVGRPASTVHRLLEFRPTSGKFERNARRPLEAALVIVDEASMLDLPVGDALLAAVGPNTHLLLVGDPDQLPPVGAGRVFADLLQSHVLGDAHVELREVIRQAAGSLIVANARRIREGRLPFMTQDEAVAELGEGVERDCFIVRRHPEAVEETVVELVCRQLPRSFQIDRSEIVVLAPMRAGSAGVERLNNLLEQRLNRPDAPVVHEPTGIRVGSRVVQCRNDYTAGVFNGELARVAAFDRQAGTVELLLEDDRRLTLPTGSLESWRLAWCLSVHRFQGSEADIVVVSLPSAHELVDRSLLYTALTRARNAAVIVSSQRVLAIAAGRPGAARNTTLTRRLIDPQSAGELF